MNLPNLRKEKRRITGVESLEIILNFGKILALTPTCNVEVTLFRKIYSTVVLAVITVGGDNLDHQQTSVQKFH
jgi:hypothetical protein